MESKELVEKRKQLGMTQVQFAEYLNTPYGTLRNWEQGIRRIPGVVEVALSCLDRLRKEALL